MTSIDTVRWATDLLLTEHTPKVIEQNLEDQLTQVETRADKERIKIALQYLNDLRNQPDKTDLLADGGTPNDIDDQMCNGCGHDKAVVEYDDGEAYCEECHDANLGAARSVGWTP